MTNSNQFNIVSSSKARKILSTAAGKPMSRQVFSKIFALMVEQGHAAPSDVAGICGIVVLNEIPLWERYITQRVAHIKSGKWASNRPHSIDDFQSITGEDNNE